MFIRVTAIEGELTTECLVNLDKVVSFNSMLPAEGEPPRLIVVFDNKESAAILGTLESIQEKIRNGE